MGLTHEIKHNIPVFPGMVPIKQPLHRLSLQKKSLVGEGSVEPTSRPWSSPVVLVTKKMGSGGSVLTVGSSTLLLSVTFVPCPESTSLHALSGSRYFCAPGLIIEYWQVIISKDTKEQSAFTTRNNLWRWKMFLFQPPSTYRWKNYKWSSL